MNKKSAHLYHPMQWPSYLMYTQTVHEMHAMLHMQIAVIHFGLHLVCCAESNVL